MIYPNNFETKIGFDTIRRVLEKQCMSPLGVAHCKEMRYYSNYDLINQKLRETNEFLAIITAQA